MAHEVWKYLIFPPITRTHGVIMRLSGSKVLLTATATIGLSLIFERFLLRGSFHCGLNPFSRVGFPLRIRTGYKTNGGPLARCLLILHLLPEILLRPQEFFLEAPFGKVGSTPQIFWQGRIILCLLVNARVFHHLLE